MAVLSRGDGLPVAARHDGRWSEALAGAWPWALCWASLILVTLGVVLHLHNRSVPANDQFFDPVLPALAVAFPPVGALMVSKQPRSAVGWLLCSAMLVGAAFCGEQYGLFALATAPGALPGATWAAWVGTWAWIPAYLGAWTLLPLLVGFGSDPSSGQRRLLWALTGLIAVGTLCAALAPAGLNAPLATNPLGLAAVPRLAAPIRALCILVLAPVGVAYLHWRARRSPPEERARLRWLTRAGTALVAVPLVSVATAVAGQPVPLVAYQAAGVVSLLLLTGAVAGTILGHRLPGRQPDPTTLVSAAAFYAALGAAALVVYGVVAALVGAVIPGPGGLVSSLVAIAVAVPVTYRLRTPLRRSADRLVYRKRSYDYGILAALARCLQSSARSDALLPAMVENIAAALRLPGVTVSVGRRGEVAAAASWGQAGPGGISLVLAHRGEAVGCLTVSPRSPGHSFDAADRRLLDDIAGQAGVVAYALCLSADLQRSREQLVSAREEERRRLRRDLHDGIKPALAGIGLGLEAVANLVQASEAADAGALLGRLKVELQAAGADLHRLVHDLRPPALDELGLVGALRQQAGHLSDTGLQVSVEAPRDLGSLPAAVEVAAYRICQEAMENARRHSGAASCLVVVSKDQGHLVVQVSDDGVGLGQSRPLGIGLPAMRERAAELGGSCSIGPCGGRGTYVQARLPLERP